MIDHVSIGVADLAKAQAYLRRRSLEDAGPCCACSPSISRAPGDVACGCGERTVNRNSGSACRTTWAAKRT